MLTQALVLLAVTTAADSLAADLDLSQRVRQLVEASKTPPPDHDDNARLGVYTIDVINSEVKSIAQEPLPGFRHCGSPSWSDDGRRILFDATPGTTWSKTHLFAFGTSGGIRKVTDLGPGNCPTLSPDGKHIAFLLNGGAVPDAKPGIWIMNADGSDRRHLWQSYGIPKWSPDGGRLLVVSFSNPVLLTMVDVKTAQATSIKLAGQKFHSAPSWAGDGRTIVAVIEAGIVLIDVTTAERSRVTRILWRKGDGSDLTPTHPVYDKKSNRCVFVGRDNKGKALYEFQADAGKTPKRLEPDGGDSRLASLAFSPDGRFVLFCSERLILSTADKPGG